MRALKYQAPKSAGPENLQIRQLSQMFLLHCTAWNASCASGALKNKLKSQKLPLLTSECHN